MANDQQKEFRTPSRYDPPPGVRHWTYRYDYPESAEVDQPWVNENFLEGGTLNPEKARAFCDEVRKYIVTNHGKFYHAPWRHLGSRGREPVSGLVYGGTLQKGHISDKQDKIVQGWTNHFFNPRAATVLAKIWGKGDTDPVWNKDNLVKFPEGSLITEEVYCDVDEDQVYTLKNAPTTFACIAELDPITGEPDPSKRKGTAEPLHLIQFDFRARVPDSWELPIGWVYGTFIYDGTKEKPSGKWTDDLIPVGIAWGNDPELTQDKHDNGEVPKQCWLNGHALDVYKSLKGATVGLGWHGRLVGPADDFMSTCSSCHSVAQTPVGRILQDDELKAVMDPPPKKLPVDDETSPGIYVQQNPETQRWFRNIRAGELFDEDKDYVSADYCWNVQIGYQNYLKWKDPSRPFELSGNLSPPFKSVWY